MKNTWTKMLTTGLLLTLSLSVAAQSRSIEHRIERKIDRLTNKLRRIESTLYTMSHSQKVQLDSQLKQAMAALRGDNGGGNPLPPPRPPRGTSTVTGSIENKTFVYDVTDAMDLAFQCVSQFDGQIGNVDDASVSVNFSPEQRMHTSGWWNSAGEVCGQIAAKAVQMGLPPKLGGSYTAVGTIEAKSFAFQGFTLREVLNQCTDFYNTEVRSNVDDLTVFNGHEFVKKHTSGWWTNANEVCTIIIQQIK